MLSEEGMVPVDASSEGSRESIRMKGGEGREVLICGVVSEYE